MRSSDELIITSRHNPHFKALARARQDKDLLALEGRRLVEEALSRGFTPHLCAVTPEYLALNGPPAAPYQVLSEDLLANLSDTRTPQGIMLFVNRPYAALSEAARHDRLIILDGVQDPGNVGTIVRTAEAFGFGGLIITPGTASPYSDKAVRASMGSFLGVAIAKADYAGLSTLDHRLIGLAAQAPTPLRSGLFTGRYAICLGQEGRGLSPSLLAQTKTLVSIAMPGPTESLNVAVAAGIVMACAAGAVC
ncbi:MAG TPA: RNA methyltransferase [Deltaproteobacteria bacterium]|nr:RNA methyltransferase [Deltaproteobacteria bacterium]